MEKVPVLRWIAAGFHVGSARSCLESSLRDHHGRLLVLDALLEQLDVFVHVEDLLENLHRQQPSLLCFFKFLYVHAVCIKARL